MTLEVSAHRDDGADVVVASGEIDLTSAGRLRTALEDADATDARHIVIDLRQVSFIDSTGLSVLVGAAARKREEGRTIDLVAYGHVRELLRVTGLDTVMGVHPDLGTALARDTGPGAHAGPAAG